MDFITGLPESVDPYTQVSYDIIAIVVDGLTKHVRFVLYKTIIIAEQLAFLLLRTVFCKNRILEKIISDRDKLFISNFIKGLTSAVGIEQAILTSFYPQTDRQTERINQILETYLRIYCSEEGEDWVQLLPTAQIAINLSYNKDVQTILDELLYSRTLR